MTALAETAVPEVVGPPPTLDELANTVRREDALAANAAVAVVDHAIRAGEALLEARKQIGYGDWEPWVRREFPDKHAKTLRLYMRLAKHQGTVRAAHPTTLTAANRLLVGEAIKPANQEIRDEAKSLARGGVSHREIAERLGVSAYSVAGWLNPDIAERRRSQRRRESKAAKRARYRQERDAAARKAGGTVAEAYALVRKALTVLEDAHAKETQREAKQHIRRAMTRAGSSEDHIVAACEVSIELKRLVSVAMDRLYGAEDDIVRASKLGTS